MPIDRAAVGTANGHSTICVPGVYERVLAEVVREQVSDGASWLTDEASDEQARAEFVRGQEAQIAQAIEICWGATSVARTYHLPPDLPPPFDSRCGGRRSFTVSADDTVRVRTMGAWQ